MVWYNGHNQEHREKQPMQTLNQDIRDHSFKRVYLLYGEEVFLKMSYKNRLKEAVTAGDTMNFNHYEGKGMDVNEIISISDTMPFFAERRLVLMEDSGWFKGRFGGRGDERLSGAYPGNHVSGICGNRGGQTGKNV